MTALLMFGGFALLLILGVPIALSLGVSTMAAIAGSPDITVSINTVAQRIFGGLDSTSIMAIAFFVLSGNLMTKGGISRRICEFARSIIGGVRGGMALTLVLACAFFAALSGSAPATVVAIGTMLYGDMVRMGYPGDRTAGLWSFPAASAPSSRRVSSWSFTQRSPAPPSAICSSPVWASASAS